MATPCHTPTDSRWKSFGAGRHLWSGNWKLLRGNEIPFENDFDDPMSGKGQIPGPYVMGGPGDLWNEIMHSP
jgi:hypothetical protein